MSNKSKICKWIRVTIKIVYNKRLRNNYKWEISKIESKNEHLRVKWAKVFTIKNQMGAKE